MGLTDIKQLVPRDIYEGLIAANAPSAANPFLTAADMVGGGIYNGSGQLSANTQVNGLGGYSLDFLAIDNFTIATNVFKIATIGGVNYGTFNVGALTDQRTYSLQDADGTLAFLTDIPAATGDGIYSGSGNLVVPTVVTMGANSLLFSGNETTFKGIGSTGATTTLLVQNSSSTELFKVNNDGVLYCGIAGGSGIGRLVINGGTGFGSTLTMRSATSTGMVVDIYSKFANRPYFRIDRTDANDSIVELHAGGFNSYNVNGKKRNGIVSSFNGDAFGLSSRMDIASVGSDGFLGWTDTMSAIWFTSEKGLGYAAPYIFLRGRDGISIDNQINLSTYQHSYIDSGGLVVGNNSINPSAELEVTSTTKGFRITPMTATQASAITPAEGLIVFTSDTNGTFTSIGFWGYESGAWNKL